MAIFHRDSTNTGGAFRVVVVDIAEAFDKVPRASSSHRTV